MNNLPTKQDFVDRVVTEPLAVRLAGEYDIWDKRDPDAELFQFGLRSQELTPFIWNALLPIEQDTSLEDEWVSSLLWDGKCLKYARKQEYEEVIKSQGFDVRFHGLNFLACCSHGADIRSQLFEAGLKPHHEALMGFTFTGKAWRFSLYHAPGHERHDLTEIAGIYGGGGHRGACGFVTQRLPPPLEAILHPLGMREDTSQ